MKKSPFFFLDYLIERILFCKQQCHFHVKAVLLVSFFLLVVIKPAASAGCKASGQQYTPTDVPEMKLQTVTSSPGEVLLQLDALNFTGSNGQIGSITLRIAIDTMLISFAGVQNTTIPGSWIANYNQFLHEITIVYTASPGSGYDLNGKLLDLVLIYNGGFSAGLIFKPNCEVSTKNLLTIPNIVYSNGSIMQSQPVGAATLATLAAYPGQNIQLPVTMGGNGFNAVTAINFLISFDSTKMSYQGFEPLALTGLVVGRYKNVINVQWADELNPVNFTAAVNLLNLKFLWLGQGSTEIKFMPGSMIKHLATVLPADYINGHVNELYLAVTSASPPQGGVTSGDGYYMQDSLVSVLALAAADYSFAYWTVGNSIVSYNAAYEFAMPATNIIVTAEFLASSYSLTLIVDPPGAGSASGSGSYTPGQDITVTAIPNSGYTFLNWTLNGAIISTEPSFQFAMPSGNISLVANFGLTVYELALSVSPANAGTLSGGGNYNAGDIISVSAQANQGYAFINWTRNGEIVSVVPDFTFTMPGSNLELVAHFQLTAFELTLSSLPAGSGILTGGGLFNTGDQIMVNAVALPGYEFTNWTLDGNVVSVLPGFIFVMPATNVTLIANFNITGNQLTLLIAPVGSGQVTGTGIYNPGTVVSISAAAEPGYSFVSWTQGGNLVSAQAVFDFTMPAVAVTLQANFELTGFELSLDISPPAAGEVTGAGLYNAGDTATIAAIAKPGYIFRNWTSGATVISDLQTLEYLMPAANITLTANFEYVKFQLNLVSNPTGVAQLSGAGSYDAGDQVVVNAIAGPGHFFLNWTKNGSIISNQPSFTYIMPADNVVLIANFVAVQYKVSLAVAPENSGSVSGAGTYTAGETVTVHAQPAQLNHFRHWVLNGSVVSILPDYSFIMPANDISLTANFLVKMFTVAVSTENILLGSVTGGGEYARGSTATIEATPAVGCHFVLWAENNEIVSSANPYSLVVDTNRQFVAYFRKNDICPAPLALHVSDIGKTSVLLHWLPAGDENSWKVLWGLRNFDTVNAGTLINGVASNSYLLENLVPDTGYDFYIKTVCSATQNSNWEGPSHFSTIPLGIHTTEDQQGVTVFPNPASDFLIIKLANENEKAISLRVIDSRGATVISTTETISPNHVLQLKALKPGVYMLQLVFNNRVRNVFFVVN